MVTIKSCDGQNSLLLKRLVYRCSLGTTLTLKQYRHTIGKKNPIYTGRNQAAGFFPRSKFHHLNPDEFDPNIAP